MQTKVLVQAVKGNKARFPQDFMFQLSAEEFTALRSQTVTSNSERSAAIQGSWIATACGLAMTGWNGGFSFGVWGWFQENVLR